MAPDFPGGEVIYSIELSDGTVLGGAISIAASDQRSFEKQILINNVPPGLAVIRAWPADNPFWGVVTRTVMLD